MPAWVLQCGAGRGALVSLSRFAFALILLSALCAGCFRDSRECFGNDECARNRAAGYICRQGACVLAAADAGSAGPRADAGAPPQADANGPPPADAGEADGGQDPCTLDATPPASTR